MSAWNEAKREAVALERKLDEALSRFTRVEVDRESPEAVPADEQAAESEADSLLVRLGDAIERLASCPQADKPPTSAAQVARLREIMFDKKREFRAAQSRLRHVREAEQMRQLLSRGMNSSGDVAQEQHLLQEQQHILNSQRLAGDVIDQASEVHRSLVNQRGTLTGTAGRVVDLGRQVPGVNTLIKRIEDKKTRDNTIIALVIAFCTCFMLWYWLSGWGI